MTMAHDPLGPITIGAREIYDQLVRLTTEVGALRSDLARVNDRQDNATKRLDAYSDRLRAVERRVWAIPSAAVVLAVLGVVVSLLRGGWS